MYVCMYVCMHVCMYVCVYVCIYLWMYVCRYDKCPFYMSLESNKLSIKSLGIRKEISHILNDVTVNFVRSMYYFTTVYIGVIPTD